MVFDNELKFEEALIKMLTNHGWEKEILKNPTEEDLLNNWASILYENNKTIDRLDKYPLTDSEMQQIIEQINTLRTPLKLNSFINGKTISIKRDNLEDKAHFGKEISLKIYDRHEIAGGESRYQIAEQPVFKAKNKILNDRRGDLTLLINGMPVIHIELKRSGVNISQAQEQIRKYSFEGVFTGIFSLVQIFVAMTPEETTYYANPGPDGIFNPSYYFHWADFYNEPINDWNEIASRLLSIPMAHQMIGFYTVADNGDGVLKVMRSYQYYAANKISDKVAKTKWNEKNQYGGYIWHTTGSGKTLTSFKSAQLIASSKDADKVIFLMDRIELGTQSLKEYRGFAEANEDVQETEDSHVLTTKLTSDDPANTLIVTSIQKMSVIGRESENLKQKDLEKINSKRIVFIIDECHRSTFGEMLSIIKETFSRAIFFGFTGTPIHFENQKKKSTTADVFGDELHRYSIADGIRDGNVLGFDVYKVETFDDLDLRESVALDKAKCDDIENASKEQKDIYDYYMNKAVVKMYDYVNSKGETVFGIEHFIHTPLYANKKHHNAVVDNILKNWNVLSNHSKFHAILATSSIPEAIQYYKLFKERATNLKVTSLFDASIDNTEGFEIKEEGLVEIIEDYNNQYKQDFRLSNFSSMKKDIAARLAHKKPYERIANDKDKQIDILIVVNQMLTGFDSKWVNTLYLDKVIEYENIIQAFSRTNRIFNVPQEKPFGIIKYYRKPNTMEQNINKAIKLYSGDKEYGLFVKKLPQNLKMMNSLFEQISLVFKYANCSNFEKLPEEESSKRKFAELFNELNSYLDAAKIQGFTWKQLVYDDIELTFNETIYLTLVLRYKELFKPNSIDPINPPESVSYHLQTYITDIDTGLIDAEYMNSKFEKFIKALETPGIAKELIESVKEELHSTFATLTSDEQKYANIILHDIESGDLIVSKENKTLKDYITQYMSDAENDQIHQFSVALGLDESKLRELMSLHVNEVNINEFGRFDTLISTVDKAKAKEYFEKKENSKLNMAKVNMRISREIKNFILQGGFSINL